MTEQTEQTEAAQGQELVPKDHLREAIAGRQKAKAERNALREQVAEHDRKVTALEGQIAELEATGAGAGGPGGNVLTAEGVEQAKLAMLEAAAGAEGAGVGDTVAQLLRDSTIATIADDGKIALTFVDADGNQATDEKGELLHDPRVFARAFMARPENQNLVRPDARELLAAEREVKEQIDKHTASPPRSMDELLKLPARVRDAVEAALSPQQREAMLAGEPMKGYL